jgi:hypothetical protein
VGRTNLIVIVEPTHEWRAGPMITADSADHLTSTLAHLHQHSLPLHGPFEYQVRRLPVKELNMLGIVGLGAEIKELPYVCVPTRRAPTWRDDGGDG